MRLFHGGFGSRLPPPLAFSESFADRGEPVGEIVGRARRLGEQSGQAACLTAEVLPARRGRGIVVWRQAFGLDHERVQQVALLGEQGAHLVPLSARGDRLSESFCQSVSLRAVADERQKRSPLFFDWNQLFEHVVAVERLDAGAERIARRNGLGAQAAQIRGLGGLALTAGDGHLGRRLGRAQSDRRGRRPRRPRRLQASLRRASSVRASREIRQAGDLLHGVAQARFRGGAVPRSPARRAASAASIS